MDKKTEKLLKDYLKLIDYNLKQNNKLLHAILGAEIQGLEFQQKETREQKREELKKKQRIRPDIYYASLTSRKRKLGEEAFNRGKPVSIQRVSALKRKMEAEKKKSEIEKHLANLKS